MRILSPRFAVPLTAAIATLASTASAYARRWPGTTQPPAPSTYPHVQALEAQVATLQATLRTHEKQVRLGRVVAGLVHDLSHPIQNIANNVSLLLRDDMDATERDAVRGVIEHEQRALRRVMDDILNVARPRPSERSLVDIGSAAQEVVEVMRAEAVREGITLTAECLCELPPVACDRFALTRVFRNLVANALEATPRGGRVTLTSRLDGAHVVVDVTDTGSGIAPDRLASLFDAFVTTRQRGHGLGLEVSKQLVEQMGGTLTVVSALGVGSTFALRLAAVQPHLVEAAS